MLVVIPSLFVSLTVAILTRLVSFRSLRVPIFPQPRKSLFQLVPRSNSFFSATYGTRWASMDAEEYADVYRDHNRGVHEFFTGGDAPADRRERFLELDITVLPRNMGGGMGL